MKRAYLCTALLVFFMIITGCHASNDNAGIDKSAEHTTNGLTEPQYDSVDSVFQENKLSDKEQAELVIDTLLNAESEMNTQAILALFAPSIANATHGLEADIASFQEFVQGDVITIERHGPSVHEIRDGDVHVKEYIASFDVTTTETEYRIAMKFLTIDTASPDNIGLHSVYVVLAEDTDTTFTYWGGDVWNAGIVIE